MYRGRSDPPNGQLPLTRAGRGAAAGATGYGGGGGEEGVCHAPLNGRKKYSDRKRLFRGGGVWLAGVACWRWCSWSSGVERLRERQRRVLA